MSRTTPHLVGASRRLTQGKDLRPVGAIRRAWAIHRLTITNPPFDGSGQKPILFQDFTTFPSVTFANTDNRKYQKITSGIPRYKKTASKTAEPPRSR